MTAFLRCLEPPDMGGVSLVEARGLCQRLRRHAHRRLVVGLVLAGRRTLELPGGAVETGAGQPFLLLPGQPHGCAGQAGLEYLALGIPPGRLAGRRIQPLEADGHPHRLTGLLTGLRRAVTCSAPLAQREALLAGLLDVLAPVGDGRQVPAADSRVEAVQGFLDRHFAERLDLQRLAGLARVSTFHLRRLFAAATGMTPAEYLDRVRVRRAAELLRGGQDAAQVAMLCGFADQSHLIRVFRRQVGLPPGRFLAQNPGGGLP